MTVQDWWMVVFVITMATLFIRNELVYSELSRLGTEVFELSMEDFSKGFNPEWRWEALNRVSYNEMVFTVWRRVSSFNKDAAFLKHVEDL